MIKNTTFCQNASCPNRDQGFFEDEMVKEDGFLFCSPDCSRQFREANETDSDPKTMRYLNDEKLKKIFKTQKVKDRQKAIGKLKDYYVSDDRNVIFSLRFVMAYRLLQKGYDQQTALEASGYSKQFINHRQTKYLNSPAYKVLEAGIIQ